MNHTNNVVPLDLETLGHASGGAVPLVAVYVAYVLIGPSFALGAAVGVADAVERQNAE